MGRQRPPKEGIIDGIVNALLGTSRDKSISSKNKNRTGGQSNSGGVGKNAVHGTGGHHSQKAKGQRGSQGPRK
jgi:hypothetical protein